MASSSMSEVVSHRACAQCRSQKLRCLRDESGPNAGCQRCLRLGRQCVDSPLRQRKQRKRTDTRVAELEREMSAMRATLKQKQAHDVSSSSATEPPRTHAASAYEAPNQGKRRIHDDVVQRGLLSMMTARQLFATFKDVSLPQFPFLVMSESADAMRLSKPVLFQAIIAAAAIGDDTDLAAVLGKEVLSTYADKVLIQSEKSVELVQALLVSALWYQPPTQFGHLKYYEFLQMAVTVALALGMDAPPAQPRVILAERSSPVQRVTLHPAEDANNPDLSMTARSHDMTVTHDPVESRRTYLALYISCTGMAMSLRRPSILPMRMMQRKHMDYFAKTRNALPSDYALEDWARLMIIIEELATDFHVGEPSDVGNLRTQLMMRDYTRRLSDWCASMPDSHWTDAMRITYRAAMLYAQEPVLYSENSPGDFHAPFRMGLPTAPSPVEMPTQVLADAVAELITNSHALLRDFLAVNVESLRMVPIFVCVRVSYAAFILAKLCLSTANPRSRIGKVLKQSDLKAQEILDRVILHVQAVNGPKRCRVPALMIALMFKLRRWCLQPGLLVKSGDDGVLSSLPESTTASMPRADAVSVPSNTGPSWSAEFVASHARAEVAGLRDLVSAQMDNSNIVHEARRSEIASTLDDATNAKARDDGLTTSSEISLSEEPFIVSEPTFGQWDPLDDTYGMQLDQDFAQFAHSMAGFDFASLEGANLRDEWT